MWGKLIYVSSLPTSLPRSVPLVGQNFDCIILTSTASETRCSRRTLKPTPRPPLARPSPVPRPPTPQPTMEEGVLDLSHTTSLRANSIFEGMKVMELKRRAKEVGVDHTKLEDADDATDVRGAVIALILEQMEPEPSPVDVLQALREELGAIASVKVLKKRAKEAGVDEERLEDADDADDVRTAVIGDRVFRDGSEDARL
jgi:hypothetical protein